MTETSAASRQDGPVVARPTVATPMCRFEDFLGAEVADLLFQQVCAAQVNRLATEAGQAGTGTRLPPVWRAGDVSAPVFDEAVSRVALVASEMLGAEPADGQPSVAYEFFMHNHGDHHGDRIGPRLAEEGAIHFAYYLHRRPRAFTGGQLRIFDTTLWDGEPACAASFRDVAADHDSIVFFPEGTWYEDRPIDCPSHRLLDGRFAFRGHLR